MRQELHERIERFKAAPERSLFALSLPVILGMIVQVFYNITDMAFVGRLGVEALAAVTFSFPLFFIIMALANLVGNGATVLIAQSLGAKDHRKASDVATHALLLSLIFAVVVTLAGLLSLRPLFSLMGAEQDVAALGTTYMLPLIIGSVFLFLSGSFNALLSAEGNTRLPAIIRVASAFINLALDALFIFGFGWGIFGASLATVVAILFEVLVYSYLLFVRNRTHLALFRRGWRWGWSRVRSILRIGLPMSGAQLLMSLSWLFFNSLFARFGTATVAAYGLVGRLDSLVFMPMMGLSVGLVTLVGMFYGAKEYGLITRAMRAAITYSLAFSVILGLLLWLFPAILLRVLTNDAGVIAIAIPLVRIEVFAYPLMAVGFLLARTLQGLGSGLPTLIVTSVRLVIVAIPLAWLFVTLGYGPRSIIVAMIAAAAVSVVIAAIWTRKELCRIRPECA